MFIVDRLTELATAKGIKPLIGESECDSKPMRNLHSQAFHNIHESRLAQKSTNKNSISNVAKFCLTLCNALECGSVAEWSKALVLGTSHFDGVGSNPTAAINFLCNSIRHLNH